MSVADDNTSEVPSKQMDAGMATPTDGEQKPAAHEDAAGTPRSQLCEWLDGFKEALPPLLWAHVTNGWGLFQILEKAEISAPELCPYFGKHLVYAFYGRPAYKERMQASTRSEPRAPVVILLKGTVEKFVHAVWPFDSGAFKKDRYQTWLASHMTIEGFSLQESVPRARRYVTAFFGDNEKYWRMLPRTPEGNHALRPHVKIIIDLLSDVSIEDADDRRLVVEMNMDKPVPFTKEYVHSIIVPDTTMDALDEQNFTETTGILCIPYQHSAWKPAIEYQALLEWLAKEVNLKEKAL